MNKKIAIMSVSGILLLTAVIFSVFFYLKIKNKAQITRTEIQIPPIVTTQSSKETQTWQVKEMPNWETYRNDEYGFKIEFPVDSKVITPLNGFKGINIYIDNDKASVGVIYYKSLDDISLGIKFDDLKKDYLDVTDIDFLGYKAFKGTFINEVINLSETRIFINRDGTIYELSYNNDKAADLGQQILSTFQFTDLTNEVSYSSIKYGFSVKYPRSWKLNELNFENGFHRGITFNENKIDSVNSYAELGIYYYENIDDVTYFNKDASKSLIDKIKNSIINYRDINATTLGGKTAYSAIIDDENTGKQKVIVLAQYDGHIYEINYMPSTEDVGAIKRLLESFKFIN